MQIYIGKKREKDANDYFIIVPTHIEKLNLPFDEMIRFSFKAKVSDNYYKHFTFQIQNKTTEFYNIFKYTQNYIIENIIIHVEAKLVAFYLYDVNSMIAYLSKYLTKEDAFELREKLLIQPLNKAIERSINNNDNRYYLMNTKDMINEYGEIKEEPRFIYNKNTIQLSDDIYYELNRSIFKFKILEKKELIEKYEILFEKNFIKFTNKNFTEILNKKIEKYKEIKKLNKNEWTLIMICPLLISLQKTILI